MKQGLRWTPLAFALFGALAHAASPDRVSALTYNAAGQIETVDGPRTDVTDITRYTYDGQGRMATTTDALGHVTRLDSYDLYGNPGRLTDPNGIVTSMTYTPEGWLATTVRDSAGSAAKTTLTYDAIGNIVQSQDPDGVVLKYTFDDASRLTDITDGLGNRIHYTLDAAGNRTKEETFDTHGKLMRAMSRTFNILGQLMTVVDALDRTVLSFDTSDGYDAEGHALHTRDAKGVQRKQGYDALSRLVSTLDNYNGTDSATANTQTVSSFDSSDNLEAVSDPSGLNTIYDHNGFGDLTGIRSPDTGTTTFTVDSAGNRLTQTDARGVVTTYAYDALNRLLSASYADTALNAAYHYDESNAVTGCPMSAPTGRLTRVVETAVTTTYCYDPRGNVIQKRQMQGTATDTITYTYTKADRVATETRPSGVVVRYAYDGMGQVSGVWAKPVGGAEQVVASSVTWLPFGPLQTYTLGNGQTVLRTFDANYRITDIVSPALELHFSLDELGNITGVSETGGGSANYKYDPLYRLTSVNDATDKAIEAYTYNQTGDRLSKTAPGAYTGAYKYRVGTHWLTGTGTAIRTYDANGNTIGNVAAGVAWNYVYSARNRLALAQQGGATIGAYAYNIFDERVIKTTGNVTTRFFYDESSQLLAEATGSKRRDYIHVDGVPVAVLEGGISAASFGFITSDGLGSPRAVTTAAGKLVWAWPYAANPFGENRPVSPSGYVLNLRLPGQYADGESGTKYNVHRDLDAAAGRYRQSDPVGLAGGTSTYSYVDSSPLVNVDLLGLSKGGKQNIGTEGFTKRSNPEDVKKALDDAIKLGQKDRAMKLRGLLKVIKRGGTMADGFLPLWFTETILREQCISGDRFACSTYCNVNADECEEAAKHDPCPPFA
jgi:RHS repeat-associated protein